MVWAPRSEKRSSAHRLDHRFAQLLADCIRHLGERGAHVGALRHRDRRQVDARGEDLFAADQKRERFGLVGHDLVRREGVAEFVDRGCSSLQIEFGGRSRRGGQPYAGFPKIERLRPEKKFTHLRKAGKIRFDHKIVEIQRRVALRNGAD